MSLLVPSGLDARSGTSRGWLTTALAGAAVCFASLPVIVHLTAAQANPFYFGAAARSAQILVLAGVLWQFKGSYFDAFYGGHASNPALSSPTAASCQLRSETDGAAASSSSTRNRLLRWRDHLGVLAAPSGAAGTKRLELRVCRSPFRSLDWMRMPFLWAMFGSFDYALFVWATKYVETAIATTAYEMWPLMLMSAVAAHQRRDRLFRGEDSAASAKIITRGQLLLGGVAAVGLAVAMLSQHSGTGSQARLSAGSVFGVSLGLASGAVSALSVASSIAYGKILFYRLAERQPGDAGRGLPNLMSLLWLTMLGHVIAKLCSVPVALVTGAAVFGGYMGLDTKALAGAALLGLMIAAASTLVRVGNIETPSPAANVLLFASPVLALGLLAMIGITLDRIGLFAAGAALVVAANIAAQCSSQRRPARP